MNKINIKKMDKPILGIGAFPFDRLGPEKFFPNYEILCYYNYAWLDNWEKVNKVKINSITKKNPNLELEKKITFEYLNLNETKNIINNLKPFILIYKPYKEIEDLAEKYDWKILANKFDLKNLLENKANFRETFKDIKIAKYRILFKKDLKRNEEELDILKKELGNKLVIQDEEMSGGKGTFFVNNFEEYIQALDEVDGKGKERIVISEFIEGKIASIQACTTKYGIINTGIQEQIISEPTLTNSDNKDFGQYCGGQFGYLDLSQEMKEKANMEIEKVGKILLDLGYKGIFGADIMLTDDDVYIIELNGRITGMTPPLTQLHDKYNELPLILFHILELGEFEYEVENPEELFKYSEKIRKGSYMIMYDKTTEKKFVKSEIKPGIYGINNKDIAFLKFSNSFKDLENESQILIFDPFDKDTEITPKGRILRLMTQDKVLQDGKLNLKYKEIIKNLYINYLTS